MELDSGRDVPTVRPWRRTPRGVPRLGAHAPLTVESLEVYERSGDGHTLGRHCGATPELEAERLARYRELPATGSFVDGATAQRAVEACVSANRDQVLAWRRRGGSRLAIAGHLDEVVGGVLRRSRWAAGDTALLPARALRVVLQRSPHYASGFAVLTAYPVRHDPPAHPLPTPPLPNGVPVRGTSSIHRGRDDADLRGRMRRAPGIAEVSVFHDGDTANVALRGALEAAGADVDDWLLCERRPRLVIDAWLGSPVGEVLTRRAYRRREPPQATRAVHVVLRRSPTPPWGYHVAAAFPRLP